MVKINWKERFEHWNKWFWWTLGFPIGAIWAAFHWNYDAAGWWLAGIYATFVVGFILTKLLTFVVRVIRLIAGKPHPRAIPFQLWDCMYEVWRRLEGPVVNPTRVREAMTTSSDEGAVWDTVSWSLIDRVIALDPAVWIVTQE